MRGKTPSVGIVNQWGPPAASSVSTSSGGNSDLRFLTGWKGNYAISPHSAQRYVEFCVTRWLIKRTVGYTLFWNVNLILSEF